MDTSRPRPAPIRPEAGSASSPPVAPATQRFIAARERAIQLLSDRFADDTLSEVEFEARIDRLFAASDPVAVEAVVADLHHPIPRAYGAREALAATSAPDDERRMLVLMGETRRTGRWAVPRRLRVRAVMGNAVIDLRDVVIPDGFTVDVGAFMGSITLIVPPGVAATCDVTPIMGNAVNRADERGGAGMAAPRIHVHGTAFMGEVKVLVREHRA
jgi:hypothetical protein